MLVYVVKAG